MAAIFSRKDPMSVSKTLVRDLMTDNCVYSVCLCEDLQLVVDWVLAQGLCLPWSVCIRMAQNVWENIGAWFLPSLDFISTVCYCCSGNFPSTLSGNSLQSSNGSQILKSSSDFFENPQPFHCLNFCMCIFVHTCMCGCFRNCASHFCFANLAVMQKGI